MLDMVYSDDIDSVIKKLTDLEKKQVPFAMSKAINRVAFEARAGVLARMDDRFTIRERSLKATGGGKKPLFVETSNKKQSVIQAVIGTPLWFLEDQEVGGIRRGKSAWLPGVGARVGKRAKGKIAKKFDRKEVAKSLKEQGKPKRKRRSKYNPVPYAKPQPFVGNLQSGKRGIFIRKFAKRRLPISLIYAVSKQVRVAPRWKFHEFIEGLSEKKMRTYFIRELEDALLTDSNNKETLGKWYREYVFASEGSPPLRPGFANNRIEAHMRVRAFPIKEGKIRERFPLADAMRNMSGGGLEALMAADRALPGL